MTMTTTFGFIEFVPWFVSLEPEAISKDVSGNQVLTSKKSLFHRAAIAFKSATKIGSNF